MAFSGTPDDANRVLPWLTEVLNPVAHRSRQPDYSFSDLVSLFVVRELRRRGVKSSDIREAESYLRQKWNTDRPFVSDEIQTDGRRVWVDEEPVTGQIEAADLWGQQAMLEMVKDKLAHVHYDEGTAAYWTPMKGVLVDPRVQFGEPVVEGTRVPTEVVAAAARRIGLEEAAYNFRLPLPAAKRAFLFEQRLSGLQK